MTRPDPTDHAHRRVGGGRVLLLLVVLVAALTAATVFWARATPSIPDARERRGIPVPSVLGD